MFDNLSSLGYGIIAFAIIIGVGGVILTRMSEAVAECPTGFNLNTSHGLVAGYNDSLGLCQNDTGAYDNTSNPSAATVNVKYLNNQMGSSGLAGWTPAIIALSVGMLFLGVFIARSGRRI